MTAIGPMQSGTTAGVRPKSRQYTLRDVLTLLFHDRRLLSLTFALVLSVFAVLATLPEITYASSARLLVLLSTDYSMRSELGVEFGALTLDQDQIVRSETEIIDNPILIERVIEEIGLETLYPKIALDQPPGTVTKIKRSLFGEPEVPQGITKERQKINAAVKRFEDSLTVAPVKDSSAIRLAFAHPVPELASRALNALIDGYFEERRRIFGTDKSRMLAVQRDDFALRLQEIDISLEQFKENNSISSFDDQKSLTLRHHADLQSALMDTEARLSEVRSRFDSLRTTLGQTQKEIELYAESGQQDSRDTARATLLTLELRRSELLTKFVETSRFVTDLDRLIADVRRVTEMTAPKLSDVRRLGRNPVYDQLESETVRVQAEAAALERRRATLERQVRELSDRLLHFDRIEREYQALALNRSLVEENLRTYTQKVEETRILEEMDRQKRANIRVIESPQVPTVGSRTRLIILLVGVLAAFVATLAVGFLADVTRDVMITPDAATRALGLEVLVAIGYKPDLAAPAGPATVST